MKKDKNNSLNPKNPRPNPIILDASFIKDEEWLTIQDMMTHLKVSRSTLNRLVKANIIPSFRLGGTTVFPKNLTNKIMHRQSIKDIGKDDETSIDS